MWLRNCLRDCQQGIIPAGALRLHLAKGHHDSHLGGRQAGLRGKALLLAAPGPQPSSCSENWRAVSRPPWVNLRHKRAQLEPLQALPFLWGSSPAASLSPAQHGVSPSLRLPSSPHPFCTEPLKGWREQAWGWGLHVRNPSPEAALLTGSTRWGTACQAVGTACTRSQKRKQGAVFLLPWGPTPGGSRARSPLYGHRQA